MPRKYWRFILDGKYSIPYTDIVSLMLGLGDLLVDDREVHTIQIIEE